MKAPELSTTIMLARGIKIKAALLIFIGAIHVSVPAAFFPNKFTTNASPETVVYLLTNGASFIDPTQPPFFAAADGITDDTNVLTNALALGAALRVPVQLPGKTFKVTPFLIDSWMDLRGTAGTRLLFASNSVGDAVRIQLVATNYTLSRLEIDGGKADTIPTIHDGRVGLRIYNTGRRNGLVEHVYVHGFGTGIDLFSYQTGDQPRMTILKCRSSYNEVGIYVNPGSEYNDIEGLQAPFNNRGIVNLGGNNNFTGCNFSRNNHNGIMVKGGPTDNSGHGAFVACQFNHANNMALSGTNINLGMIFTACEFLPPLMAFTNCSNWSINNSLMGWITTNTITLKNCTNMAFIHNPTPYGLPGTYAFETTDCLNVTNIALFP